MEKLYNDAQTPPNVKARLRRDIDAYTLPQRKTLPYSVIW